MNEQAPHDLYRYFNGKDLLYIGIGESWRRRLNQHANKKPWFPEINRVETEEHPDLASARQAERHAIQKEHPRYNIQHNHWIPVELSPEQIRQNIAYKFALGSAVILAARYLADVASAWWLRPRMPEGVEPPAVRNPFVEEPRSVPMKLLDLYLGEAIGRPHLRGVPVLAATVEPGDPA